MRPGWQIIVAFALMVAMAPYLLAWSATPEGYQYQWNSYNPPDTDTYLAKMRLGWLGAWRFRLLHTPEPHEGAYLNLFYVALGHVARLLRLPLLAVFHGARLGGALFLLGSLWWLSGQVSTEVRIRQWATWFALAGGGVGWAAFWLDPLPVDLSVPESSGFLSILVNPHFPVAQALLALLLGGVVVWARHEGQSRSISLLVLALSLVILSLLQPFAVITVGLAWGGWLALEGLQNRHFSWRPFLILASVGILGILYPFYGVWATAQDPILSAWNAQNVNLSPPWWSWVLGYALVIPLAGIGAVRLWRQETSMGRMLVVWIAATIVGIIAPLAIQRRFSLGLSIPLGMLAGPGWDYILSRFQNWKVALRGGMGVLTLATPLAMSLVAVRQPSLAVLCYIHEDEIAAADFLLAAEPGGVVLSSPRRGEALPWLTGQWAVVGHPMETVAYPRREAEATAFFDGTWDEEMRWDFLCREGVDYIWWGPVERALSGGAVLEWDRVSPVFENAAVSVFSVGDLCLKDE